MAFKSSDGRLEGYWIGEVGLCVERNGESVMEDFSGELLVFLGN